MLVRTEVSVRIEGDRELKQLDGIMKKKAGVLRFGLMTMLYSAHLLQDAVGAVYLGRVHWIHLPPMMVCMYAGT